MESRQGGSGAAERQPADHQLLAEEAAGKPWTKQLGIERTVKVRCSNFLSVPSIIGDTDLLMVVPEDIGSLLARDGRIKMLPVPFALPNPHVKQLWHRRFHNDAANKWLRVQVARLFLNKGSVV